MHRAFCFLSIVAASACLAGCDSLTDPADAPHPEEDQPVEISAPPPEIEGLQSEHVGPHGGHVIELGKDHRFHAELLIDAAGEAAGVYILDGELNERPVVEQTVVIAVEVADGKSQSFSLQPAASTRTADGRVVRFDAADSGLYHALHGKEAAGKLRVSIDGVPYVGDFVHHHHQDDCTCRGHEHESCEHDED